MTLAPSLHRLRTFARLRSGVTGHVDRVINGDTLLGWAADPSTPEQRLVVECVHEGRVVATARADEFREDIKELGIGDGAYGFRLTPPPFVDAQGENVTVQVRIQGSGRMLTPRAIELQTGVFLWFIAADIVNNCNLRCPFCLVDYSGVTKTQLMAEETFRKLVQLAPSVLDGQFYLSCLHEPTLHPRLNEFLALIPEPSRRKMFFTTNLARPLKAADFEAWAHSGLHHINVSLDSLDPERFARLRKFGRFEVFQANLDLLTQTFARVPEAPPMRFITMAFASNFEEIPEIVRVSRERWRSSENEIRYTFNVAHITDEFRQNEYLHKADWDVLTERLQALGGKPVMICYPPADGYEKMILPAQNFFEASSGPRTRLAITRPLGLRIAPDGTALVSDAEHALRVDINSLEDPVHFFRALLRQARPRTDGATVIFP
jgi:MoaA/NifB/PqqE/SkfB family radical SAM enzyme